jgi:hypothetical protein
MASLENTLLSIKKFIKDVEEQHPKNVAAAALSAASLIIDRVGETGISSDGSQMGEYSDGLYKQKRAKKGHPVGFVNLRFTGEMWNDVKLIRDKTDGILTVATIGATRPENDAKLFKNSVRYNDEILALNDEEASILNDDLDNKLQEIADKNFSK